MADHHMKGWATRAAWKQQNELPQLIDQVTAACEARLAAGRPISRQAIGVDLGRAPNWACRTWLQPAVAVVDRYAEQQQQAKQAATANQDASRFIEWNGPRHRFRAVPVAEAPMNARCYFRHTPAPNYRLFRRVHGQWKPFAYASTQSVWRLALKKSA